MGQHAVYQQTFQPFTMMMMILIRSRTLLMMMIMMKVMQVWGYWGSVPTDIPASQPLVLGFNEPDHENQVKIMMTKKMTTKRMTMVMMMMTKKMMTRSYRPT